MTLESEQRQHELDEDQQSDPRTGIAIAVECLFIAAVATLVWLMARGFQHAAA